MSSLYDLLGVTVDADIDEIRSRYKKLCMIHHPDKGGDSEYFKELTKAYEILIDPEKRKQYDKGVGDGQYKLAVEKLQNNMLTMIGQSGLIDGIDYVASLRVNANNYIDALKTELVIINQDIDKYTKARSRIKNKNDKSTVNIFDVPIVEKITRLREQINQTNEAMKTGELMIEILADYESGFQMLLGVDSASGSDFTGYS